jgi:hypothetical protein
MAPNLSGGSQLTPRLANEKASKLRDEAAELAADDDDALLQDNARGGQGFRPGAGFGEALILSDDEVPEAVDDMMDSIDDLCRLLDRLRTVGVSLRNPPRRDLLSYATDSSASGDFDEDSELRSLQLRFPEASLWLIKRMVKGRKLRTHYLRLIEKRRMESGGATKYKRKSSTKKAKKASDAREMAAPAFNFSAPHFSSGSQSRLSEPPTATTSPEPSVFSQPMRPSATASAFTTPSIFSRPPLTRSVTRTTISSSLPSTKGPVSKDPAMEKRSAYESQTGSLELPSPPITPDGIRSFICQFCGFDVLLSPSYEDEWAEHVLEDLMAFFCTWDQCPQAQLFYGLEEEWYKHELEYHRIPLVWICEVCQEELGTADLLRQHLVSLHGSTFNEQAAASIVKTIQQPTFSRRPLGSQQCPLCADKLEPAAVRQHIGFHLKSYALSSVMGGSSTEEDDDVDSESLKGSSDGQSVGIRKAVMVQAFAEQQLRLVRENGYRALDDEDEDRFGDSDDEGDEGDDGPVVARDWRLEMLPRMAVSRGPRPAKEASAVLGPPSSSSTGHQRPSLHTRKFPPDDEFTGREKDLGRLFKALSGPGRVYVVSAEGGMGKTALAVEYTYRFEASYDYIFWVQAETPVGTLETFNEIGLVLNLAPQGTDQKMLALKTREFLEQTTDKRWLLVFDNVEKWEDIDDYCPNETWKTNGSILITTRDPHLTAPSRPTNYFRMQLGALETDEGRKLLIQRIPEHLRPSDNSQRDIDYRAAGDIAELAGFPLVILLVSGYMKTLDCSPSEMLNVWNDWRVTQLYQADNLPRSEALSVEDLMEIRLPDLNQSQLKLLRIVSFLDSDGVPRDLLEITGRDGPMVLKTQ